MHCPQHSPLTLGPGGHHQLFASLLQMMITERAAAFIHHILATITFPIVACAVCKIYRPSDFLHLHVSGCSGEGKLYNRVIAFFAWQFYLYIRMQRGYLFTFIDFKAALLTAIVRSCKQRNNSTWQNLTERFCSIRKCKTLYIALFEICTTGCNCSLLWIPLPLQRQLAVLRPVICHLI